MKLINSLFFVSLATTSITMGCAKKSESEGGEKSAVTQKQAEPVAESEQDKAFEAWKNDACKCTDLTCASQSADALIALEKIYPDWKKITPENKKAHDYTAEGNACKRAALKVK